jgi:hypothetical protein
MSSSRSILGSSTKPEGEEAATVTNNSFCQLLPSFDPTTASDYFGEAHDGSFVLESLSLGDEEEEEDEMKEEEVEEEEETTREAVSPRPLRFFTAEMVRRNSISSH